MIDAIIQKRNENGLRVIKTAKTIEEINKASNEGFWPLIRKVIPSEEIKHKMCMIQNSETGEVEVIADRRTAIGKQYGQDWKVVLPFFSYYPHIFPNPYAAYLIPADIIVDEKVYIEEVIEDIVSASWQDNTFRLKSAEAVWDGQDLKIIEGQAFEQGVRIVRGRVMRNKLLG